MKLQEASPDAAEINSSVSKDGSAAIFVNAKVVLKANNTSKEDKNMIIPVRIFGPPFMFSDSMSEQMPQIRSKIYLSIVRTRF